MGRFLVVNFIEEQTIAVVPESWEQNGHCFWPPVKAPEKIKKLVLGFTKPDENWLKVKTKILYSAESYEKARKKLKKAEDTSDLNSELSDYDHHTSRKHITEYNLISDAENVYEAENLPSVSVLSSSSRILASTPPSSSPSPDKVFQKKVLKLLEEIKLDQQELRSMISTSKISCAGDMPQDCPTLPIDTPQDLLNFDDYLNNKIKFSQICTTFGGVGGLTYTSVTRRILMSILTTDLSVKYNWKGTGGVKLAFSQFQNVIRLITTSVRQHTKFEKVTEQEVENSIKKWLIYAKDRNGGRAKRAKKIDL